MFKKQKHKVYRIFSILQKKIASYSHIFSFSCLAKPKPLMMLLKSSVKTLKSWPKFITALKKTSTNTTAPSKVHWRNCSALVAVTASLRIGINNSLQFLGTSFGKLYAENPESDVAKFSQCTELIGEASKAYTVPKRKKTEKNRLESCFAIQIGTTRNAKVWIASLCAAIERIQSLFVVCLEKPIKTLLLASNCGTRQCAGDGRCCSRGIGIVEKERWQRSKDS